MLSIYYGTKLNSYVCDNTYEKISDLEFKIVNYRIMNDLYKYRVKGVIEQLKNKNSYLLYIDFYVTDREVYITEVRDAEVLNIGHKVKLFDKEGKVTDKKYDATNNIMYYYTDIVMETVESEEVNSEFDEITAKAINQLEELYEHYFSEPEKKKGFFKRLFG